MTDEERAELKREAEARKTAHEQHWKEKTQPNGKGEPPKFFGLMLKKGGKPLSNAVNSRLIIEQHPLLRASLTHDDMACMPMLMHAVMREHVGDKFPRPLTDGDDVAIQCLLQQLGLETVSIQTVRNAISQYFMRNSQRFHPVRDYLDALKWDGRERLDTWIATYAGCAPTPYNSGVGKMFMISMVARIYQPGCQVDYMIVLEGPQGTLKSTLLQTLAGSYYSDCLPDIHNKDASAHLVGTWLCDIPEMSAYGRADASAMKAFLTRRVERYRRSYGHREVTEPRQCVFAGTTNHDDYLKDETGNRRQWPLKTGEIRGIDIPQLKLDRDQLFAEAVHCYRQGEPWWPTPEFEAQHIKPEQAERQEEDVWEEPVLDYVDGREKVSILQVLVGALGFDGGKPPPSMNMDNAAPQRKTPLNRAGRADQNRVKRILLANRWTKGKRDMNACWFVKVKSRS